ncbi:MAG: nicotinate (nicotinamide) nucleotide adenylyltransferase [Clostridiales bacterium]|nr:nicotinate (nicotinamide) nucleotide adenylyltransferase [Clostridiales bacterium]
MRIGIYGGSFNPPHRGHTSSSFEASKQLGLDKLIVVPSGEPPHKRSPEGGASAAQRLEMTRIAFSGFENAEVSDIELLRPGESYTIDTVREMKRRYPGDELFLIVGTDMFLDLDQWKDSRELLRLAAPVTMHRGGCDFDDAVRQAERLRASGCAAEVVKNAEIDISSTEIRSKVSQRLKIWHIDDGVYSYIIENGLYSAKPDFDWLRHRAYELLEKKRIPHVAGCEEAAVRLSERWGADPGEAREAAILHDITKKLDAEEQLSLCGEYDIETDELERQSWKLLHSKTAAAYAAKHFCVSKAVESAIEWHTTGRADMTLLEKVIYLADYIEPNRSFAGIEKMRRLAFSDLDAALIMGMEMSIEDLESRGILPHPHTLGAVKFLRER